MVVNDCKQRNSPCQNNNVHRFQNCRQRFRNVKPAPARLIAPVKQGNVNRRSERQIAIGFKFKKNVKSPLIPLVMQRKTGQHQPYPYQRVQKHRLKYRTSHSFHNVPLPLIILLLFPLPHPALLPAAFFVPKPGQALCAPLRNSSRPLSPPYLFPV